MKPTTTDRGWTAPSGRTYPIVEANWGTMVYVNEADVASGVQKDPFNCAIAQTCKRVMNAPEVAIGGTVAYVVTALRGRDVAVRYGVPSSTRRAIDRFDKTGVLPAEGFSLTPLKRSQRLAVKQESNKRRDNSKDPAYQRGTQPETRTRLATKNASIRDAQHLIKTVRIKPEGSS